MKQPHNFRAWLAFVHDLCAAGLAWAAMYWLRFGLDFHEPFLADMARTLVWILPLQAAIFIAFGLYRGLWRFASVLDLQRIVLAAGLGALLIPLVLMMLQLQAVVPRSVLIFYPIVLIFLMAGDRFAYRIWKEHRLYSPLAALGEPVLVIGAGEAGARLTREFARSRQWRVVGLIDDDPAKQGRLLDDVERAGTDLEPPGLGDEVRRAPGDRRAPLGRARRAPARRGDLRRRRHRGADGAVVRGSDQRPLGADHDPHDRARRPAGPRSGGARQRRARRVARQPRGHGHRRGGLDRRRAVPAHRPFPPGEAGAVRPVRGRGLRDPDRACRRVPAAAAGDDRRRRQARRAGRRGARAASGRASSSMPARTSTCR